MDPYIASSVSEFFLLLLLYLFVQEGGQKEEMDYNGRIGIDTYFSLFLQVVQKLMLDRAIIWNALYDPEVYIHRYRKYSDELASNESNDIIEKINIFLPTCNLYV